MKRTSVVLFVVSNGFGDQVHLRMPSSVHFGQRFVSRLAASTSWTGDGSVLDVYKESISNQLESLTTAISNGEAFHLDALAFGLNASSTMLRDLGTELGALGSENRTSVKPGDYAALIRATSRISSSGAINSLLAEKDLLQQHAQLFRDNYNIIYVENIFDANTFHRIHREALRLWKSNDIEANCNLNGVDRLGGYIHLSKSLPLAEQRDSVYSLIYGNEPLRLWISAVTGTPLFPADFPIELREYGPNSRGMGCHADIQMYADLDKNYEVVVTISNHGDCEVYWFDKKGRRQSVKPSANSITIVQPNSAVHCVTGTRGGAREMLKFIMVGRYQKHADFYKYVANSCSASNANVRGLANRRMAPNPSAVLVENKQERYEL